MKTKYLLGFLLTTILLLVTISTVSATLAFTVEPSSMVFTQAENSTEITITNTGNETATFNIQSDIKVSDGSKEIAVTLDRYSLVDVPAGESEIISASVNPESIEDLEVGIHSASVEVEGSTLVDNLTQTLSFSVHRSYCEQGPIKLDIIEIRDVDESGSSSDDDWTWFPQDEITLSIKVKNNDDDNDHEVRVEWDLYDTKEGEFLDIGDDDTVDVNDNDYEWIEFTFDVPYDLERGSNYLLYVKAYDDDEGEEEVCSVAGDNGKSAEIGDVEGIQIEIKRERNDVEVTKTNIPELLSCGSTTDVDLWIANIGRSREDKIKVTLLESDFGPEISREISKLDWDDKAEKVSFPITAPEDLEEGIHALKFRIYLDYDEDDDEYDQSKTVSYDIEVKGNCIVEKTLSVSISAELDSDAVEGQQLVIKGTVENTGEEETTYSFAATDYSSWAELDRIEPNTQALEVGESQDFFMYFNVDEDAAGEQFFTIKANYNGESTEQEVSVMIEQSGEAGAVTGEVVGAHLKENWFIWVIVIINIILIIAIILVARRIVTAK